MIKIDEKIPVRNVLTCGLDSAWLGQCPKVASFEYGNNTGFIPAQSNGHHLRKNDYAPWS
jgi:hypothetical protein